MDSYQYWRERETEQRMNNISDEKKYDAEIEKIYKNMLSNTQKEIDAFYGKYATKEGISMAEAKKRVDKLDIEAYSEKAKKYVANRDLSPQANEEMRLYNLTMKVNRLEMLKANIGMKLVDGFSDLDEKFKKNLTTRTQDELERQAGILGKTVKNPSTMANSIVNASFNNATFSQRIWSHQELLKSELNKQLQSGLISGKNPRDLARSIQRVFDSSTYNAERLMRTELARVQTDAQAQSYERNGFAEYEFLALGSSACEICRALDGKHFKVDKMLPGENAPPMHPNCRCSTGPYMDDKAYNEWLDAKANEETDLGFNEYKPSRKTGETNLNVTPPPSPKYSKDIVLSDDGEFDEILSDTDNLTFRGMPSKNPMSDWGHAMFADKGQYFDTSGLYTLLKSGRHAFFVEKSQLANFDSVKQYIQKAWNADKKAGLLENYGFVKEQIKLSGKSVSPFFNPVDIVDSADAYDSKEFNSWFYDRVISELGVKGVLTSDGAVVYDESIIHEIIPDKEKLEKEYADAQKKAQKEAAEKQKALKLSPAMSEYNAFKSELIAKYTEDKMYSAMTDHEMEKLDNLEYRAYKG